MQTVVSLPLSIKKTGKMGSEGVGKGGLSGCPLLPPPLPKLNQPKGWTKKDKYYQSMLILSSPHNR
jgi:hypothetical protein